MCYAMEKEKKSSNGKQVDKAWLDMELLIYLQPFPKPHSLSAVDAAHALCVFLLQIDENVGS